MRQLVVLGVVLAIFAWVFVVILRPGERDPAKAKAWQKLNTRQRRTLVRANLPEPVLRTEGKRELEVEEGFPPINTEAEGETVSWPALAAEGWRIGKAVPPSVLDLHGRYVTVRGYMLAVEEQEEVSEFLFIPSYARVYFKRVPTLTDFIKGKMATDPVRFTDMPLYMTGRLSVGLERVDGEPASLYRMEVVRVEAEGIFERHKHKDEDERGQVHDEGGGHEH